VVAGTSEVAVRLSSGDVVRADIVGTAPNYDLGVIRLRDLTHLPPPIVVGSSADLKVGQFAYAMYLRFPISLVDSTGAVISPPPLMMIGFVFAPEIASTFVEDADPTFVGSFVASLVR